MATQRWRIIFFGFIAIVLFSELLTSNLYSLLGPLESTAEIMGVSVAVERERLLVLIALDAVGGFGALGVLLAYRGHVAPAVGRGAVLVTALGLLAYGAYQFWAASCQLGRQQDWVRLAALVYTGLGMAAWFAGGDLRRGGRGGKPQKQG